MAKTSLLDVIMWIVGVLVSLAVGFGMVNTVLTVRYIPETITVIAGWIVVIGAVIGVIMAIAKAVK